MKKSNRDLVWFQEVGKDDIPLVGGKGANLGEMTSFGIPVPPGFIVTSRAYFTFIKNNKLKDKIHNYLKKINVNNQRQLKDASLKIKKLIINGKISDQLAQGIISYYLQLGTPLSQAWVAVRSSATAEDLPTASFAGQQWTFLNVKGEANVVQKVKECWASLFEPRAIFYREERGFSHFKVGVAVPVQKMVAATTSGVMFTIDPVSNEKNKMVIEAIYGLGELIVQGMISPDQYLVEKNPLSISAIESKNKQFN